MKRNSWMQVITLHFSLYFRFDFPSRISVFLYNTDNYATMPYTSLFQVISTNFRCIAGNSLRNSNYIELSSHTYRRRINLKKNIIESKIKYFTGSLIWISRKTFNKCWLTLQYLQIQFHFPVKLFLSLLANRLEVPGVAYFLISVPLPK